jgi:Mg-chelatase subunit ChlD
MGSLEKRIQRLEDLYHAGEARETGDHEEREREFRDTLRGAREKAEMEERMGDPRRMHALNKLEAFLKWKQDLSEP